MHESAPPRARAFPRAASQAPEPAADEEATRALNAGLRLECLRLATQTQTGVRTSRDILELAQRYTAFVFGQDGRDADPLH